MMTDEELRKTRGRYADAAKQDRAASLIVELVDELIDARELEEDERTKARCPYCRHAVL